MRLNTVREDIVQLLNEKADAGAAKETPLLAEFSRDLTEPAHEEPARPARRPRATSSSASSAGALPPHQEQRRAHRRARRRQDGDRRGPRAEDRLRRRAALPRRQAHPRARHLADRRRHEVPRPVRRAPQGDHEGADREPEHHRLHRRAAHAGGRGLGRRLARRGQHPEAGALARRDPLHRRDDARRVPEVHREGPLARAPLPGDQGRLRRPRRRRSRSCSASRTATRSSTTSSTRARRSRRRSTSRAATSPTASCPTRRSTWSTRPAPRQAARAPALQRGARVLAQDPRGGGPRRADRVRARRLLPRAGGRPAREPAVRPRAVRRSAAPGGHVVTKAEIDEVVSKWTGVPHDVDQRGRVGEAAAHGGGAAPADRVAGEGDLRDVARHPPLARRPQEPEPAGRQLRVPRARPASARPSWRARSPNFLFGSEHALDPLRHVRVHGEALGLEADRLAARLRRATKRAASSPRR